MLIAIDPETGELTMPSADQIEELTKDDPGLSRSSEGLVEVHRADGAITVDLKGRFAEYAVARVGADGKLHFNCVHDRADLDRQLVGPPPPPVWEEE